jgi:hypothetical protein
MQQPLPLSHKQARLLTDRIVSTPKGRWSRIAEGHARGVAAALGYPSWEEYCDSEFGPERFRIPRRLRYEVLNQLKEAGMTFEDVEAAVIPRDWERPETPPSLVSLPTGSREDQDDVEGELEDELGFTSAERELVGVLLELDDEEFNRVLVAGRRHHDLSPAFIRDQAHAVIRSRESLERNLDRALRSVERAQDMVERGVDAPGELEPSTRDLLKLLEDETWDLIDAIDRLNVRLEHRSAHRQRPELGREG